MSASEENAAMSERGCVSPCRHTVHVRVPATSANLGSGFDTAGIAVEYFDELTFTLNSDINDPSVTILITGEGADTLPRDERHLVVKTFRHACDVFGLPKLGFTLDAVNRIPQARGMGSSAEAIVAGVAAAAAFADPDIDRDEVFALAAELEGHPDNVAPAVYGNMTVSWNRTGDANNVDSTDGADGTDGNASAVLVTDYDSNGNNIGLRPEPVEPGFHTVNYQVAPTLRASIFVPDYELSTEAARHALPAQVPFADASFNVARSAMLPAALNPAITTDEDANFANALLFDALDDKLHQQYRLPLMEPSAELISQLRAAGFAASVSGAGPCVLVLNHGDMDAAIDDAAAAQLASGHWNVLHLSINATGVQIS